MDTQGAPKSAVTTSPSLGEWSLFSKKLFSFVMTLLAAVAVALVLLPRSVFQATQIGNCVSYFRKVLPKLDVDWLNISRLNPGFENKFVFSFAVLILLTGLCVIVYVIGVPCFWPSEKACPPTTPRFWVAATISIHLVTWFTLFTPTPFEGSRHVPPSELGILYIAAFDCFLFMATAGFLVAVLFQLRKHRVHKMR